VNELLVKLKFFGMKYNMKKQIIGEEEKINKNNDNNKNIEKKEEKEDVKKETKEDGNNIIEQKNK
jgi:hypothetical protein